MRNAFMAHFNTPHIKEQLLAEWRNLRAGDGPNAIRDYITKFNIALAKCDAQPMSTILFQFRKGLPPDLEYALGIHEGPNKIVQLDKLQDFAQNLEYILSSQRKVQGRGNNNNNNTTNLRPAKSDNSNTQRNNTVNTKNAEKSKNSGTRSHCVIHGDCAHTSKDCTNLQDRREFGLKTMPVPHSKLCTICDDPNHNVRDCPHNRINKGKSKPTYAKAAAANNNNNGGNNNQKRPFGSTSANRDNNANNQSNNDVRLKAAATRKSDDSAPQPKQK
jgi:hypothetical protein